MTSILDGLTPSHVRTLHKYSPGKPIEELERELGIRGAIKLASNENPLGPSPKARQAIERAAANAHRYPDGGGFALRSALARRLSVPMESIALGAGSNELIYLLVRAFCRPGYDRVVAQRYAFISYHLSAAAHGVDFVEAPVDERLAIDIDGMAQTIAKVRPRIVFLGQPNNPTGAYLRRVEMARLLEQIPRDTVVVVDEAYFEYATPLHEDYPNSREFACDERPLLVTLRTFSKIHGLAGLRVGYAIAHPEVVDLLDRIRRPFHVSSIAQAAAVAALDDEAHVEASWRAAEIGLGTLAEIAVACGFRAYPSATNFILIDVGRDSALVHDALLRRGVIARPMAPWGLPQCLRLSIARPHQLETVGSVFRDLQ